MIVRENKTFEQNSRFPDSNWYLDEPGNLVVDETTPDGQVLAAKIRQHAPFMDLVVVGGQLVDVTPTERPPDPEPEPTLDDRVQLLESENAVIALELIETQIALEQSQAEQAALLLALVEAEVI